MKIGFVIPYLRDIAGGEHATLAIAAGLQDMGHDVRLYCYTANPEACFPQLSKKLKIVSYYDARKNAGSVHEQIHSHKKLMMRFFAPFRPYYEMFMMRRIAKLVEADCDIICAVNQPSEWAAEAASARIKKPWVWLCLEPPFYFDERIPKGAAQKVVPWPLYEIWDKRAAKGAAKLITLSKTFKPYIDKLYGVDCAYIHLPHLPGSHTMLPHQPRSGKFRMLFVASFSVYKRPQDAVEAMQYVPDAELDLIGMGYMQEELETQIKRLGLSQRVRLVPRMSEEKLAEYYSRADAFICTSEQSWGLVALDAIERGVPVITSPACGVSEIFEDGKTALFVPDRDPKAIAEKIKWLMDNPDKAARIVAQAKGILAGMTVEKYCRELLGYFEQAVLGTDRKKYA